MIRKKVKKRRVPTVDTLVLHGKQSIIVKGATPFTVRCGGRAWSVRCFGDSIEVQPEHRDGKTIAAVPVGNAIRLRVIERCDK